MAEREKSPSDRSPRPVAYEPEPGERFAQRYRIEALLGRGAAGAVWAALDEEVGDRVALKLLHAGPDDAIERFRREVRLARRVTHRNAARIFDLGAQGGVLYLTMELVDGESLDDLLSREGPLSIARTAQIGNQIALGLAAAHEVSVIHRDIKPANVLLESTGRVVLTDFGVARATADEARVTMGAAMIGTPSYMAPEQVRGETVGPRTDLYALGAMLYEMLTGRVPFVADSVVATAMARLESDPVDPRQYVAMPEDVASLVLRLMERSPDRRPESAAAVAEALAVVASRAQSGDSTATLLATSSIGSFAGTAPIRRVNPGSAGTRGSGSTFVSIAPEERTLAVLPFRLRGPDEHAHLAEVLGEDLVDILTTTRSLRVSSSSATAKYEGQSVDPREAGRELGVDAIVDGTLRVLSDRLRVSARLVDVGTGEQLWVDRFEGALDDALLQETAHQRIAEGLRRELELLSARHRVPEEAIELLLEARQRAESMRLGDDSFELAIGLLDRAIEMEADFALAMAAHADYAVRRWFTPSGGADETVSRQAHESVERALREAPELPLTHLAAARLAVSDGRFDDAASELGLALSMAPTFAPAHDYLGMLQCEAGRGDEGERHILLARHIDPTIPARPEIARRRALAGDLEGYAKIVAELKATPAVSRFMIESLELRVAGWFGDLETVRRSRPSAFIPPEHEYYRFLEAQRAGLLGEGSSAKLLEHLESVLLTGAGPRLDAFTHQLAIESLVPLGDLDNALVQLRVAVGLPAFVDTDWMERCPALDELRAHPDFAELVATVRRRTDAIWRVRAS